MPRDQIYALPRDRVGDFQFDDDVASVFPDMIARSVPGYGSVLSMIEQLTSRYAQPDTHLYDLGCSLGAATLLMQNQAPASCTIHAIDNSEAMIRRLREKLYDSSAAEQTVSRPRCRIELHQENIGERPLHPSSFVVFNWTLQFIPAAKRDELLQQIHDALLPGGALLLSEKVAFDDAAQQMLLTDLHHDFKRANGYSELEIAQKRTSLENRLTPESIEHHIQRLYRVGFRVATVWFQCFNFASILAIK